MSFYSIATAAKVRTISHLFILDLLYSNGACNAKAMVPAGLSRAGIHNALAALIAGGFILERKGIKDGREVFYSLTAKGRELTSQLAASGGLFKTSAAFSGLKEGLRALLGPCYLKTVTLPGSGGFQGEGFGRLNCHEIVDAVRGVDAYFDRSGVFAGEAGKELLVADFAGRFLAGLVLGIPSEGYQGTVVGAPARELLLMDIGAKFPVIIPVEEVEVVRV